ncbi:hypothetical protein B0J13DRAFT_329904 [Dactylonectria estremocensis]|uniref:Uncharacterized protein n=1 Tax=Dactylonectria estremocensis TaxID=1079267 RepID=A0A9P9EWF7_9HYPO|nr:hypothetical protein B0J13DRAFT_329904 [Dactylonectria estremocensis]
MPLPMISPGYTDSDKMPALRRCSCERGTAARPCTEAPSKALRTVHPHFVADNATMQQCGPVDSSRMLQSGTGRQSPTTRDAPAASCCRTHTKGGSNSSTTCENQSTRSYRLMSGQCCHRAEEGTSGRRITFKYAERPHSFDHVTTGCRVAADLCNWRRWHGLDRRHPSAITKHPERQKSCLEVLECHAGRSCRTCLFRRTCHTRGPLGLYVYLVLRSTYLVTGFLGLASPPLPFFWKRFLAGNVQHWPIPQHPRTPQNPVRWVTASCASSPSANVPSTWA